MAQIVLNPLTGKFDIIGMTATELAAYVKIVGDTMTGALVVNTTGESEFNGDVVHSGDVYLKAGQKIFFDDV